MLTPEESYSGGTLEVGMHDTPAAAGTAVIFPAYLLQRARPMRTGTRRHLLAWFQVRRAALMVARGGLSVTGAQGKKVKFTGLTQTLGQL